MYRTLALVALCAFSSCVAQDAADKPILNAARLLVAKTPLSQYAIENMEFVLEYLLVNVGDKPALKVSLDDRKAFPTQDYELVKGLLQVHWDKIEAGTNVSHAVVVKPRRYGVFNHTSALVTYYPTADAKEARVSLSTAPGEGTIYSQKSYERRFGQRWTTWLVFVALTLPTTLIPLYIWLGLRQRYPDAQDADSKKKAK